MRKSDGELLQRESLATYTHNASAEGYLQQRVLPNAPFRHEARTQAVSKDGDQNQTKSSINSYKIIYLDRARLHTSLSEHLDQCSYLHDSLQLQKHRILVTFVSFPHHRMLNKLSSLTTGSNGLELKQQSDLLSNLSKDILHFSFFEHSSIVNHDFSNFGSSSMMRKSLFSHQTFLRTTEL